MIKETFLSLAAVFMVSSVFAAASSHHDEHHKSHSGHSVAHDVTVTVTVTHANGTTRGVKINKNMTGEEFGKAAAKAFNVESGKIVMAGNQIPLKEKLNMFLMETSAGIRFIPTQNQAKK